ncbi:MAG: DUF87 domain-containing protein [Desulfurococcales archaeon]|nr:DUF87 domain-containing protein [Desulfurococcales archaeon]
MEVESYTQARAVIYSRQTSLLRYGALALVEDHAGPKYLALVTDVMEHSIMPAIDSEKLSKIMRISSSAPADPLQIMQKLFSPTTSLVQWHGVREVRLRILGQITQGRRGPTLALPERPPRPPAIVREPDPALLGSIVSGGLGPRGLRLGELAYNRGVEVLLDPDKLTMHMAIVGQTGSGKTETVKRLVAEYAWRKHLFSRSGGVIVFDIAGEYTGYPYKGRPDIYPLLDAILDPQAFGAPVNASWLSRAKKTVLVPYDLASISFRAAAERAYFRGLRGLLADLASRLPGRAAPQAIAYGRHGVYLVDAGGRVQRINRAEAAQHIINDEFLVVAAPLPSTLSSDEVEELSHSSSAAYRDLVETLADTLGLLDVSMINEVKGLAEAVNFLVRRDNNNNININDVVMALREAGREYIRSLAYGAPLEDAEASACRLLRSKLSAALGFVDCRAWAGLAAYFLAVRAEEELEARVSASTNAERMRLLRLMASYIPGATDVRPTPNPMLSPWLVIEVAYKVGLLGSLAGALSRASQILEGHPSQTRASVARGLRRVARYVSPYLDALHYRLLVERLVDGFSIVHLAPPSRGDTDYAVARLVEEAFYHSLASYDEGRRTLIVVEEAHNLAPARVDRASKRILVRVAREGRKWGLSLVLVTQRPGFIDPDVLSQAATLAALRITNPEDLSGLRRGSESTSQELLEGLPDLEQGQAVVAGMAVPERRIPLLVKVDKLDKKPSMQGAAQPSNRGP